MKEELKELVAKHLPSLAAGEMSKYIEQAEKDKKTLSEIESLYKDKVQDYSQLNLKYNLLIGQAKSVEEKGVELNIKETNLKDREFNLKVAELEYKLTTQEKAKLDIFNLVNTFVSNPRAIEMISKNTSILNQQYWDGNRNQMYPTSASEFGTIEKKETKTN